MVLSLRDGTRHSFKRTRRPNCASDAHSVPLRRTPKPGVSVGLRPADVGVWGLADLREIAQVFIPLKGPRSLPAGLLARFSRSSLQQFWPLSPEAQRYESESAAGSGSRIRGNLVQSSNDARLS